MVPMLTCGLVRSNFAFATGVLLWTSWFVAAAACGATLAALSAPFAGGSRGDRRVAGRRRGVRVAQTRLASSRSLPGRLRWIVLLDRPVRAHATHRSPSR